MPQCQLFPGNPSENPIDTLILAVFNAVGNSHSGSDTRFSGIGEESPGTLSVLRTDRRVSRNERGKSRMEQKVPADITDST